MPNKVIQGNRFWYQSKAHMQLKWFPTNLHPFSRRFQVIAAYLSSFRFRKGEGGGTSL